MIKTVATQPGVGFFHSTLMIVVILICMLAFFAASDQMSDEVERVAAERVVTDMRQAVAMMLYDYAIKRKLVDLAKFDRENPFVPLAIYRSLPLNYRGVVANTGEISASGWYFLRATKVAVYRFQNRGNVDRKLVMEFVFDDLDGDGVYGPGDLGYLKIAPARSAETDRAGGTTQLD